MNLEKGTYIINLEKSEEELLAACDKDTRYCIRKSIKYHIPPTIYENVYAIHLQDKQYKPTSVAIFKIEGEKATLLATNTDSQFKGLQGNSLAYWTLIRFCKQKGLKQLDLGGIELVNPTDSQIRVAEFKAGYGGQLITWKSNVTIIQWLKAKLKRYFKK